MFASLLSFFFYSHGDHRDLHSFPTRRSSDLYHMQIMQGDLVEGLRSNLDIVGHVQVSSLPGRHEPQYGEVNFAYVFDEVDRSEEHTSELQSRLHLVCRLLLEKKNKKQKKRIT